MQWNLSVRAAARGMWLCWCGTGTAPRRVDLAGTLVFPKQWMEQASPPQAGLEIWLDASDSATIQQDASGKVQQWRSKGSRTVSAVQADASHRPTYIDDALGGQPALRFDEKRATRLELPDLASDKIDATILVVFQNPTPGSEVNHDARLLTASDGSDFDYQIGLAASVPGMQTGGPRQSVWTFRDRWAKSVHIGCFSPNYQTFFTGDIAEILVYSRQLSAGQLQSVRTYLAIKWNLW